MKKYIGCSGFKYDEWKGQFYPEEMTRQIDMLEYYCKNFNAVEINFTYYKLPQEHTLNKWVEGSPKNFRFIMKASRYITHSKKLKDPEEGLTNFYESIEPLGEKLLGVLFQIPGNFTRNIDRLENFLDEIASDIDHTIEFRHESWWDEEVFELLDKKGVTLCTISSPSDELPQEIHMTTDQIYLRLHGAGDEWYDYDYHTNSLKKWLRRIEEKNPKQLNVFFNNDINAQSTRNASKFIELMNG